MSLRRYLQALTADPVPLGAKEKFAAVALCFLAIFWTGVVCRSFSTAAAQPLLVASMGASAVILFVVPNSPLAQPWPFVGGQLCSAFAGVLAWRYAPDTVSAAACAAGLSVLLMLLLRCLHPPGTATALTPVLGGEPLQSLGFDFVLFPVAANVALMLLAALLFNRLLMRRHYPLLNLPAQQGKPQTATAQRRADIAEALRGLGHFVDISGEELGQLLNETEKLAFKRYRGDIRCADIMRQDVVCVEYATEVEDAWALMQQHKLKAMPVLGASRHLLGVITPYDFFKYVDLNAYGKLSDQFRAFVRRTTQTSTHKPEAAGHIMTKHVVSLSADAHIAELVPLMCDHGHRHIPIVDNDQKLVGMVYQNDLLGALYLRALSEAEGSVALSKS